GQGGCTRSWANTAIASPKARGGRPAVAHPPPSMCLPRATYLRRDGGDGGAHGEERRRRVQRLAEEIALAKPITDGIKNTPPSPGMLDLASMDQRDELAASLWLNEKDPLFGPVSRAFKAFGLDHRNHPDWYRVVACLARVLFPVRRPKRKKWTAERLFLLL